MSVKIQSNYFQNVFLRMDGEGVDNGPGGTVNCQWGAYSHEEFNLLAQQDGTFAIESVKFPGVYLRMDCDNSQVNCQTSIGPYEKFLIIKHCDDTYVIASNYFSGKYLRMDGNGVNKLTGKGSGTVNYQTSAGPYEKFKIA